MAHKLMSATCYYIADPMCSWCWGFADVLAAVRENLPNDVEVTYVMGGLAPDSAEPMPENMKSYVQKNWDAVAAATGARFNWDFWKHATPRRSTYPACRAVIAAGRQGNGYIPKMFQAIQSAYYLQARNPSDESTLIELASENGLDTDRFALDLRSTEVEARLQADFQTRRTFGANQFPSLLIRLGEEMHWICKGYAPEEEVLAAVSSLALQA